MGTRVDMFLDPRVGRLAEHRRTGPGRAGPGWAGPAPGSEPRRPQPGGAGRSGRGPRVQFPVRPRGGAGARDQVTERPSGAAGGGLVLSRRSRRLRRHT